MTTTTAMFAIAKNNNNNNNTPQIDKFSDSSFTRSRSSSSSSTTNAAASHGGQAAAAESIQRIAFLDPTGALSPPTTSPQAILFGSTGSFHQQQQQQTSGSGVAAQSSSGGNSNHKSLSSIDTNSGGQLALWVGTSNGGILLVNLTLPDNEDNRILQLQSINADPIPQASIKLGGQILCLEAFVCEPRSSTLAGAQRGGPSDFSAGASSTLSPADIGGGSGGGHHSGSGGKQAQLTSGQSSSLESSAQEVGLSASATSHYHHHSTSISANSGAAGGSGAPAGGHSASGDGAGHHHSSSGAVAGCCDSRSVLFFAIVSQKHARIYQVPSNVASWSPTSGGSGSGSGEKEKDKSGSGTSSGLAAAAAAAASSGGVGVGSLNASLAGGVSASGHQAAGGGVSAMVAAGAASTLSSSSSAAAAAVAAANHSTNLQLLPSQLVDSPLCKLLVNKRNLLAECELSDTSYACHSQIVKWRSPDECCLVSYLATGQIVVHSLPRLKPILLDVDFVPYTNVRLAQTMRFSKNGHCLYQPSQGEICKFTISSSYKSIVNDMLGLLYVPREMPEQPRTNFFKSLFSVSQASKQSDRDELFGSECGKASRSVAKHLGGSGSGASGAAGGQQLAANTDKLKSAAIGTMGHEMRMAREGLDERGERLGELEDRTLNMLNQSETYAQAAHQLAQKFKDKKWYQF